MWDGILFWRDAFCVIWMICLQIKTSENLETDSVRMKNELSSLVKYILSYEFKSLSFSEAVSVFINSFDHLYLLTSIVKTDSQPLSLPPPLTFTQRVRFDQHRRHIQ